MKTIAATALILTLSASAFAAEPGKPLAQDTEKAQAPIVLTATQLDGVTAGAILYGDFEGDTVQYLDVTEDANTDPYRNFKFKVSWGG